MSERDRYIPGVPCWIDTTQPDPEAAVAFYSGLFGWEFEDVMPPDSPGRYFIARIRGGDVAAVASQPDGGAQPAAWNTYVWVEDADETAAKVRAAGGTVLMEPDEVGPDSGRMAMFTDPAGAAFCAWQPNAHRGAAVVNEHGALNFNDLYTRDLEGARAFYGAVFGWVADTFTGGGMEFTMLRLPGYGDFLEQRDPDLRTRQAASNAPPGFEDVVAGLVPMTSDQFPDEVPSHWSVTFTVDDTDEVATRAGELGGTVIAPPFDAGPTRVAVVRDPQGAVFTVSRFDPDAV